MRINLNFAESNAKEVEIIKYLDTKLNAHAWIKELIYQEMIGRPIVKLEQREIIREIEEEEKPEIEEIIGIDNIDI